MIKESCFFHLQISAQSHCWYKKASESNLFILHSKVEICKLLWFLPAIITNVNILYFITANITAHLSLPRSQSRIDQEDICEALRKIDRGQDGQVNFEEFSQSVAILAQGYVKDVKGKDKAHHWIVHVLFFTHYLVFMKLKENGLIRH